MSEGLKALYRIKQIGIAESVLCANGKIKQIFIEAQNHEDYKEDLDTIEKELKQAEENERMLNVFKNALTIERKPINNIHAFKKDRESRISALASEIIEIKQNELDKKLRKSLREWVLKNAFPKELKRLEELEKAFDSLSKDDEKAKKLLSKEIENNRAFEIIKSRGIILRIPENEYSKEHFDIHIYTNTLSFEEICKFEEIML